jgi:aminoglycoside phosphotransferase family enzyme
MNPWGQPQSTRRKLEFLSRRATYPEQRRPVEVIETHFAWVFLTERHAYKMKKPLRQYVRDYRSLASRARGCRDELRLNRRLAPTVYLEVVPLGSKPDGSLVLGRGRRIVDWLVKMRRLPASRMLDVLIAEGAVSARDRNALIDLLAGFYARARPRAMQPAEYVHRLYSGLDENLRALRAADFPTDRADVLEVERLQRMYLDSNIDLLRSRAAQLIDGHGDLRPEHIYLGTRFDAACVIDCLESDARLRRLDPLEELAFLALECRRLGAEDLGRTLERGVQVAIGDVVPNSLIDFYKSRQALTRAKLAVWRLRDPHLARRRHWMKRAASYVKDGLYFAQLALQARQSDPIPVSGRSGSRPVRPGRAVGIGRSEC